MVEEKNVSKKNYIWAHIGVIIYHVLTAILLIVSQYIKLFNLSSKTIVLILSSLLLIISLLSIIPISMNYKKIIIS